MKKIISICALILVLCTFLTIAASASTTEEVFADKIVNSYVFINQTRCYSTVAQVDVSATYHLYCDETNDHKSKKLTGTTTHYLTVSSGNGGLEHTLMVDHGTSADGVSFNANYAVN